ncbi:MAG: hypothetical protein ACTSRI_06500 [Promethearchaeota archaeon]
MDFKRWVNIRKGVQSDTSGIDEASSIVMWLIKLYFIQSLFNYQIIENSQVEEEI